MDDTQTTQQPTNTPTDAVSSMNDVVGMTPPSPAPVMPEPAMPTTAMPGAANVAPAEDEDYSAAEDVLNEILDSLDRLEAKLDAIEKKMG